MRDRSNCPNRRLAIALLNSLRAISRTAENARSTKTLLPGIVGIRDAADTAIRVAENEIAKMDAASVPTPTCHGFDHRENPGDVLDQLKAPLAELGVILHQIDSGSDQYIAFLGRRIPTQNEIDEVLS